ncbi:MAG: hypothetical protein D3923_18525, partial [Candidatus Electrothrix sp. AR3]|nr:hypothetical protein [Candidatus Electrothrix sp. AR3]
MKVPNTQTGRANLLRQLAYQHVTPSVAARLAGYAAPRDNSIPTTGKEQPTELDKSSNILQGLEYIVIDNQGNRCKRKRFWHLHKRKKIHLSQYFQEEQFFPPELRKIRPLRMRELHFPNIAPSRISSVPQTLLKQKKKRIEISRQIKAIAQYCFLPRPLAMHRPEDMQAAIRKPHIHRILGFLSPAEQVEPQLLSALIRLLPSSTAGRGLEHAIRFHPDILLSKDRASSLVIRPEKRTTYFKLFQREDIALREKIF